MARSLGDSIRLEQWALGDSPLHRADPRAKVICLLVLLLCIATTGHGRWWAYGGYGLLLGGGILSSRIPSGAVLRRVLLVLPFPILFGGMQWIVSGDGQMALSLVTRTALSALAVLVILSTTPMPALLTSLRNLGMPALLVTMVQMLLRYLTVIVEQGLRMRNAAVSRGGRRPSARAVLTRGGGALAVLFFNSYERAEAVHWAMLARGFRGEYLALSPPRFSFVRSIAPGLLALGGGVIRYAAGA